jgi:hypothetical protein
MSKKSKPTGPPKFAVGDHVRVKAGVSDPDYPDMPLGGWAGTVVEVQLGHPIAYVVHFNQRTVAQVHPVYRNRCERDGLDLEEMSVWEDDVESDTGEPSPIEQPRNIVAKPLSMRDKEDRLRAVFGLTSDDLLPEVDEASLLIYHKYLVEKLTFPFEARYSREIGPLHNTTHIVTVLALLDPDDFIDEDYGLFCEARHDKQKMQLPIVELEVGKRNPNRQLLDDYSLWFGNWQ